jgi:hypothetical protein
MIRVTGSTMMTPGREIGQQQPLQVFALPQRLLPGADASAGAAQPDQEKPELSGPRREALGNERPGGRQHNSDPESKRPAIGASPGIPVWLHVRLSGNT